MRGFDPINRVGRDGLYTVRMTVEDERGGGPICYVEVVNQVNVYCTGGEHTHNSR